jgi:sulfite exporter TauE/SafE
VDHHALHQTLDLFGFLTLGLLGGFGHCVGMCSPFVLFVSRRYVPPRGGRVDALAAQGWYGAGRITTYACLGAAAGSLGAVVQSAAALVGLRQGAMILAGGTLVVWAAVALSDLAWFHNGENLVRVAARLKGRFPGLPAIARQGFGSGAKAGHPYATGLFLGLLPCGFLYSAVIAAVALGGPLQGAAALVLFGVGTAPALLTVSLADELIARGRPSLNRLAQVFTLAMGAWFLWRGLAG